jgi:hypothetical protein
MAAKKGGRSGTKRNKARLRPGELDGLVLAYMGKHQNKPPPDGQRHRQGNRTLLRRGGELPPTVGEG